MNGITDDDQTVIKIHCEYLLNYDLKQNSEINEEDLKNFSNTNALYNAWPYIREFVQSMCNKMEIPSMTLPLLRIVPERKKIQEEKDHIES